MEPGKPTAPEVVHSLDQVLAAGSPQDAPDDVGAEPLWAPLMGRNFDAFLLEGRNERWTRMARLGTSGASSNPAMRAG
jgi:hypothetical protein